MIERDVINTDVADCRAQLHSWRRSWGRLVSCAKFSNSGVTCHRNAARRDSAYVSDPNGIGIEVLYEIPDEYWKQDVNKGLNFAERLPKDGPEALEDSMEYDKFLKV